MRYTICRASPDAISANGQVMPDNHIIFETDCSCCVIARLQL